MTGALDVHVDGVIFAKQPHGGISRNFVNLMNAMALRSDTRVVLHQAEGTNRIDGLAPLTFGRLPHSSELRPRRVFGAVNRFWAERSEKTYWRSLRDGIFHSSYYTSPDGVMIPQILTMHDVIAEDYPDMFRSSKHLRHVEDKRRAVNRCSAVLMPSQFSLDRTRVHYDIGDKPTMVAPHAVDPSFRSDVPSEAVAKLHDKMSPGRPFLLHVGSRYLHKNVQRLLVAFSTWSGRKDFSLVLAGGGTLSAEEHELIDALKIREYLVVIPRLVDVELLLAYHAAAAFVFPSLSEGYGFPVLEAMACGKPVACSRAASLVEVGREFPVYFEPTDTDDIRNALDVLVASIDDERRWQDGKKLALARTWNEVAADYLSLYGQVKNT